MKIPFHPRHTRSYVHMLAVLALLVMLVGQAPRSAAAAPVVVDLEFDSVGSGIKGSGFPAVMAETNLVEDNVSLSGGALNIQATGGDLVTGPNSQDNALSITPYTSSGSYTIGARLINPRFLYSSQSAGIYIGNSSQRFIRFTAGVGAKRTAGERLQLDVMDNGKLRSSTIPLPAGTFASITSLDLFLNIDHTGGGKITALYRIDSDASNAGQLATTRNFPRWLRQGNAGAVYAGVITTNRGAPALADLTVSFDWFRLTLAPQVVASVTGTKTVDKDGVGATVSPGDTLTYTIRVTNTGAGTNVQIADPIPVDTTYVADSATGGASYDPTNDRVTWSGSLGTGISAEFTFKVKINQAPLQSSTILNAAAMTYGGSNFPALLSASTIVGGVPDLSDATYTATPAVVGPNGTLTYVLTLLNDGTAAASNVTTLLTIPAGTTYVSGTVSASGGSQPVVDPSLTQIRWNLGSLAVNGTAMISFSVQVGNTFLNGAPIASLAVVQATGMLPNIETAQATYSVATSVAGSKTVDKAEVDPRDPLNNKLTYTITVFNNSGAPAAVRVVDPIPTDTGFVDGSLTLPAVGTASVNNGILTWSIPSLAAAQSATISFQVAVGALPLHSSVILNKAVLHNDTDGVQTLLSAATAVKGMPDLSDAVYTADPGTVGPNGVVTYALALLNVGTAAANNANVQLSLPAGTTLVGAPAATSGTVAYDGASTITWHANQVGLGGVVKISFQARVTGQFVNGAPIASQATIQCTNMQQAVKIAQAIFKQAGPVPPQYQIYLPLALR